MNLDSGQVTNFMLGELMPVRDFPNSKVTEYAAYAHDEIRLGSFTLIPGLRYQSYQLDAEGDPIFEADNPNTPVVDASEDSLAPKLGLLWHLNPASQLYLQYARGFRAPPFEDLNIGLDIPMFNIRAIPNPDLEPETSDGIELGFRFQTDTYRFSVAGFGVDYDNLIDTKVNLGIDPATGVLLFQSQNIDKARVYGAELNFNASLERWVRGLSLDAAASITRGRNRTTDEPLNTVDPAELVTSLVWQPGSRTRLAMVVTAVAAQDRVDHTSAELAETDGYVVFDFTGSIRITENLRLDAGLFNAFDKTYWQWSSIRNRPVGDPMIDYLSAPGRYASVSLRANL
jgi:hemoglobin/transferrin/lactoferrin receptor protein